MLDELSVVGGVPIAGTGQIRINDNTSMLDDRWGTGFGWNRTLKTVAFIGNNLNAAHFATNRPGDRFTVYYRDGGAADPVSFTIAPTGLVGTVVSSSAEPGWRKVTVHVDWDAGATATVKKKSGAQLMLGGACVWDTSGGLMIHNVGQGGSSAYGSGALNDRWVDDTGREALGTVFADPCVGPNPLDLLIISLGGNDKRLKVADELVFDAIRRRRQAYPDSDCILVAEGQVNDTLVARAVWETFVAGMYDLADELDVPLIDQYAALGPYKTTSANGWNADSAGHLKAPILEQLGRTTARTLLAS